MTRSAGVSCFISDLHLDPSRPVLTDILLRLLASAEVKCDGLYVLGDLFEAWIGDDAADSTAVAVASALRAVSEGGTPVFFIAGNRDFLLGQDFAASAGMRRLSDPCVVDLYGRPSLLSHGDALCTSDLAYQAFRQQVRDPDWQASFLAQPIEARRAYAARARAASAEHQRGVESSITDVEDEAVVRWFQLYGINRLIHGHTHRPNQHAYRVADRDCQRIVLADWHERGEALFISADGIERQTLR